MAKGGEHEDTNIEEAGEARVYELGFHLDPELPTEEVKSAYQSIRSLIMGKGEIVAEGEPEKIPLAYTISRQGHAEAATRRDFDSAFFSWIAYEALVDAHSEIVTAVGADRRIIRFIDLVTDKETVRAAKERAELAAKIPENEPEIDAATDDAALDAALLSAAA